DGWIQLAATRSDAMRYQYGTDQNEDLRALYPDMGEPKILYFDASALAGDAVRAYTRVYSVKTGAPAQTAAEPARYGTVYDASHFEYINNQNADKTLTNIQNNILYPISAAVNHTVFGVDN